MSRQGHPSENLYAEVEEKLGPLASPLEEPAVGDWLAEHPEPGQTFRQYLSADPVCRDARRTILYVYLLGDFSGPQEQVLALTRDYLGLFFDVPVQVRRRVPLADVPPGPAGRTRSGATSRCCPPTCCGRCWSPTGPATPWPTWP